MNALDNLARDLLAELAYPNADAAQRRQVLDLLLEAGDLRLCYQLPIIRRGLERAQALRDPQP